MYVYNSVLPENNWWTESLKDDCVMSVICLVIVLFSAIDMSYDEGPPKLLFAELKSNRSLLVSSNSGVVCSCEFITVFCIPVFVGNCWKNAHFCTGINQNMGYRYRHTELSQEATASNGRFLYSWGRNLSQGAYYSSRYYVAKTFPATLNIFWWWHHNRQAT